MAAALLLVVSIGLALTAARLRVRRGLVVVVGVILLVPATLSVPNPISPDITVVRLVIVAFTAGLVWRTASHRLPMSIWRPGPVHVLAFAYVVITFATGVGAAVSEVAPLTALGGWLDIVDQMVVLIAGIAAFRAIADDTYGLRLLGAGLLAITAIGFYEHFTKQSFAQLWYTGIHSQQGSLEARDLVVRSGEVRVRGAAQFALEYAWLCVLLLPALVAAALTCWRRRWLLVPAGAAVVFAIVFSVTRSAFPAAAGGLLALALLARDRRITMAVSATAIFTAAAILVWPHLTSSLSESVDPGSVAIRSQRLPLLFELLQNHKVTGLGFGGLDAFGLRTTDFGWVSIYGSVGTLGLVALIVLYAAVIGYLARGVFQPQRQARITSAVALTSLLLAAVAGFVYDTFTVMTTGRVIWLVAAIGLVSAERVAPQTVAEPGVWRQRLRRAALASAGGLAVGVAVYALWPRATAFEATFELFPPAVDAGKYEAVDTGKTLLRSACDAAGPVATGHSNFSVQCRSTERASGEGILRISGPSTAAVKTGLARVVAKEQSLFRDFKVVALTSPQSGVPAPVADSPLGLALLGGACGLLLPISRRSTAERRPTPVGALQGALQ